MTVRLALASEKRQVVTWVSRVFSQGWAEEAAVVFDRQPVAGWISRANRHLARFDVYGATARGRRGVDRHLMLRR